MYFMPVLVKLGEGSNQNDASYMPDRKFQFSSPLVRIRNFFRGKLDQECRAVCSVFFLFKSIQLLRNVGDIRSNMSRKI